MLLKTTLSAAIVALSANAAVAGGLSPEIVEATIVEEAVAPAGPSINPAYIVVGVLAALLIASAGSDDPEEEEEEQQIEEKDPCLINPQLCE